jgi:hypothetical protein
VKLLQAACQQFDEGNYEQAAETIDTMPKEMPYYTNTYEVCIGLGEDTLETIYQNLKTKVMSKLDRPDSESLLHV